MILPPLSYPEGICSAAVKSAVSGCWFGPEAYCPSDQTAHPGNGGLWGTHLHLGPPHSTRSFSPPPSLWGCAPSSASSAGSDERYPPGLKVRMRKRWKPWGEAGEEAAAVVVEVLEEAVEERPAPRAAPWSSLPQRQEGQAVFHERHEIPWWPHSGWCA